MKTIILILLSTISIIGQTGFPNKCHDDNGTPNDPTDDVYYDDCYMIIDQDGTVQYVPQAEFIDFINDIIFPLDSITSGINFRTSTQNWRQYGNNNELVFQPLTANGVIQVWNQSASTVLTFSTNSQELKIGSGSDAGNYRLQVVGGNAYVSGEVVIGTTTDSGAFPLQVNGNSYLNGEARIGSTTDAGAYNLQVVGDVYIDDVLLLKPTAEPGTPAKGMIYMNDSNNHLYVYNGTTWVQLDN